MLLVLVASVALLLFFVFKSARYIFYQTAANELTSVFAAANDAKKHKTVVVIGGSISGLTAASVLSKYAEKVILIEQQQMQDNKTVVAHGIQAHILLPRGQQIFESLFPGFAQELQSRFQATFLRMLEQTKIFVSGFERALVPNNSQDTPVMVGTRRTNIEQFIRDQVQKLNNVQIRDQTIVKDLITDSNNQHVVQGIVLDNDEAIKADLVVDCTGINCKSMQWLQKRNISVPQHKIVSYVSYSTFYGELKESGIPVFEKQDDTHNLSTLYYPNMYPSNKFFLATPVDNNMVVFIFGTLHKEKLPENESEMEEFIKGEPFEQSCRNAIKHLKYVPQKFHLYKKEGSQYNEFDKINVQGLIALGDSYCSFNPIYGQGMSSAAEACALLDSMIRNNYPMNNLANEFHRRMFYIMTLPWILATSNDIRFEKTTGARWYMKYLVYPIMWRLMDQFMIAGSTEQDAYYNFTYTLHMREGYGLKFSLYMLKNALRFLFAPPTPKKHKIELC